MGEARWKTIARLLAEGVDREEIRLQLGISRALMSNDVFKGRQAGVVSNFERVRPKARHAAERLRRRMEKDRIRGGRMDNIYSGLPPETQDWLVAQVPTGATMAETIAAIIVDTYHEERGE